MIGRRQKKTALKIAAFSTLALLCVPLLAILFWFKAALGQAEPVGTISIILAAVKMERTGADIVPIGQNVWLTRVYKDRIPMENGGALDKLMSERGWKHTDQEGSERIYSRGKDVLEVPCEMYTGRYQICHAREPL